MLEATIPALWTTLHGWFTPTVLFLLLNLVIGTIAVTSKVTASAPSSQGEGEDAAAAGGPAGPVEPQRRLSRVPSMALDRLRSFKLSLHAAPAPEPPVTAAVLDLWPDQTPLVMGDDEEEVATEGARDQEHATHMERSRSEAAEELPPLPARLRKSASELSAFAHFVVEPEEEVEAVEARRPATTRERAAEPEETEEEEGEVDARADDFINKFRHDLKLQRIESFIRYRDTIRRGQAVGSD